MYETKIVRIVGCGTVGSNIFFKLWRNKVFRDYHIYDKDVISYGVVEPPFYTSMAGVEKVVAIADLIESLGILDLGKLVCHHKEIKTDIDKTGIILDCRDDKARPINSHARISLDGSTLIIDTRDDPKVTDDYSEYSVAKDFLYVDLATSIVCNVIDKELLFPNTYYVYNLRAHVQDGQRIERNESIN
jgi:hypothetical protein